MVTKCSAERSFPNSNKLKIASEHPRLVNLVNLAIMSIDSDILCEIDFTAIISDFAVAKSRKVSGL